MLDRNTELGGDALVAVDPVPNALLANTAALRQSRLSASNIHSTVYWSHAMNNTTRVEYIQPQLFAGQQRMLYKSGMALGARLKKARTEARMTQATLSEQSGVSQAVISALETRDSEWTKFLVELASALCINELWLSKGEGPQWRTEAQTHSSVKSDPQSHAFINPDWLHSILDEIERHWGGLPEGNGYLAEIITRSYARLELNLREQGRRQIRTILSESLKNEYKKAAPRGSHARKSQRETGRE